MKYGVREICNVVLKATVPMKIGSKKFYKDEPVFLFDSLKTSNMDGSSSTVYAQGGRGNSRLVAWEGDRTVTFTMEDALASAETFALLTGSKIKTIDTTSTASTGENANYKRLIPMHVELHKELAQTATSLTSLIIEFTDEEFQKKTPKISATDFTNLYIICEDKNGTLSEPFIAKPFTDSDNNVVPKKYTIGGTNCKIPIVDKKVIIRELDFYYEQDYTLIEIEPEIHNYNFYLEAETLFRDAATGLDYPANFIIPNCRIQPNFTFAMSNTGDPGSFTFTIDAFPGYLKGGSSVKKILAAIQIIDDTISDVKLSETRTATPHATT